MTFSHKVITAQLPDRFESPDEEARDTPAYGPRRTAEELRKDLAAAKRYKDQ